MTSAVVFGLFAPGAIHQSICLFLPPISNIRYQLLLRDLVRYTEKGLDILARRSSDDDVSAAAVNTDHLRSSLQDEVDTLSRALHIMTIVPKMANDMMMVGRLQGFDVRFFSLSLMFVSFISFSFCHCLASLSIRSTQ